MKGDDGLAYPALVLAPAAWGGIVQLLERCLELAHRAALPAALLLLGVPGLGREALALELAAALTCRRSPARRCPCPTCDRVRRGVHPDVHLLPPSSAGERRGEGAGETGREARRFISIDDVRDLTATLEHRPFEGARRVVILDSVHTPPLGVEAAVALLKALEEPPPHVVFLALASHRHRVLPTIASRTVEVRVPPPTYDEAVAYLAAALQLGEEEARARLAACSGDLIAALTLTAEEVRELGELVAAARRGEGVALGAIADHLKRCGTAEALLTAIVATLRQGDRDDAEELLAAAAALMSAQRLAGALHLGLDAVGVGRLLAAS